MRRLAALVAAAWACAGVIVLRPGSTFAGATSGCSVSTQSCSVGVGTPGSPGGDTGVSVQPVSAPGSGGGAGGSSSGPCPAGETASYVIETSGGLPVTAQPGDVNPLTGSPVKPGSTLEDIYCNGVLLTVVVVPPGGGGPAAPKITGAQLAQQALSRFKVSAPTPMLSPTRAVVNYPTWLWLQGGWSPQSATATVPGLSATVTARPTKVVWNMGDGGQVTCDGPGTAYNPNVADSAQHTDCSYTYATSSAGVPGGTFTASVTVYFGASWKATDGTAGQLGTVTGAANFPVTVEQIESVNT